MAYQSPYRTQAETDQSRATEYLRLAAEDEERERQAREALKEQIQLKAEQDKEAAQARGDERKDLIQQEVDQEKQRIQDDADRQKDSVDAS